MKVVYIASPLTPTEEEIRAALLDRGLHHCAEAPDSQMWALMATELRTQNRANAARWVAWAAAQHVAPIATWITLTGEWTEEHRKLGLAIDLVLIERCDEVWLCGLRISSGMSIEAERARELGKPIINLTGLRMADAPTRRKLMAPPPRGTRKLAPNDPVNTSIVVQLDDGTAMRARTTTTISSITPRMDVVGVSFSHAWDGAPRLAIANRCNVDKPTEPRPKGHGDNERGPW